MKKIILILLALIGVCVYINFEFLGFEEHKEIEDIKVNYVGFEEIEHQQEISNPLVISEQFDSLVGQSYLTIEERFGLPDRIDPSAYGYNWWVYHDSFEDGLMMIGIDNTIVVTVYYIGTSERTSPFIIGTPYEELNEQFNFTNNVSFNYERNSYQFQLTGEELKSRPLIQVEDFFVQLYFDTYTQLLSGVRFLDTETLIKHQPYSVHYRGELIEPKELTLSEWKKVEEGSALHVFYITNEIRKRHDLDEFHWHSETANVAYEHSKDMMLSGKFSHISDQYGTLANRLERNGVLFQFAGENIAAYYVDGIASVEGWLNSEGHREALLYENFTHLGVGVYQKYYTQNFITPW